MVLSWDFEFTTDTGKRMVTRTSQDLLEEVTYPVAMHQLIDNRLSRNESVINNLFVQTDGKKSYSNNYDQASRAAYDEYDYDDVDDEDYKLGEIHSLKDGYGFIKFPPNNLFFHHTSVIDGEFGELREGDEVEYTVGVNEEGQQIARNVRLIWEEEEEEVIND
jgi:cold shock CspA family protein